MTEGALRKGEAARIVRDGLLAALPWLDLTDVPSEAIPAVVFLTSGGPPPKHAEVQPGDMKIDLIDGSMEVWTRHAGWVDGYSVAAKAAHGRILEDV
jgi:hypothetical protein